MASRSMLVAVASAQLAAQLAGHVAALRRRRHFDVPFMTGSPDHLVRDWLWFGTAYSAPPYLLGPQLWAVTRLLRGPDDRARWVLRWLGAGLTLGYLSERLGRVRVSPSGFDPLETPIVVAGWSGAIAMAVIARSRLTGMPSQWHSRDDLEGGWPSTPRPRSARATTG
jgi:hypothetical protein